MPTRIPTACARCGRRECECRSKDERPSASRRGYSSKDWGKLRLVVLAEEPLCRFCLEADPSRITAAEHVDHIIPIRERPDLRLVRSNLRALCAPCHNRRTATDMR